MTIDEQRAIAAMVVDLVQPVYTTAEAQVSATLLLVTEARRIADAIERYAPIDGALLQTEERTDAYGLGCVHPADHRTSMGSPGHDDFFCRVCERMVFAVPDAVKG